MPTSPNPLPVRRRRLTGLRVNAFDSRLAPTSEPSVTSRLTDAYRSLLPGLEDRMYRVAEVSGDALTFELRSSPAAPRLASGFVPLAALGVADLSRSAQSTPDWGALIAARAPHRMLAATH